MASLDSLPPDQRAVLQLVLQRGRSYDEIAQLLSIDRAAVRERALTALDALGPGTRVPPERRALITDYLLGQLPGRVTEDTRSRLAEDASERAWARVVASELGALANGPLPEIPVESVAPEPAESAIASPQDVEPEPPAETAKPPRKSFRRAPREPKPPRASPSGEARKSFRRAPREPRPPTPARSKPASPDIGAGAPGRPSSRRGGAVLIGGGVLVVVLVVIVIVVVSGGGSKSTTSSAAASAASTSTRASSTPTSSGTTSTPTSTTGAKVVAQVNLSSPTGAKKTAGVAVVVKQGASTGLVIRAQGLMANSSHDAYAVWLYNSASDNHILGFVNPGVKADGKLQTAGVLPANASHFKQILVTLETQAKPRAPSKIVLQGALNVS
jgi:Sigma-70, region 4